jgi:hypothetical protein
MNTKELHSVDGKALDVELNDTAGSRGRVWHRATQPREAAT